MGVTTALATTSPSMAVRVPDRIFTGLDHVGIAVHDLDRSLELWQRLGLKPQPAETNEGFGVREAMLALGPPGVYLQLLMPTRADSMIAQHLDAHGEGIQQIAFRVANLDRATADLAQRGFSTMFPGSREGSGGTRIDFLEPADAGGLMIELVEERD